MEHVPLRHKAGFIPEARRHLRLCVKYDCPLRHLTPADVERYALGQIGPAQDAEIVEHLLLCERCRNLVTHEEALMADIRSFFKTCVAQHPTEDGVVEFWIERGSREWVGRIESPSVRSFYPGADAQTVLRDVSVGFQEMFPEHVCSEACRVPPSNPDL